MLSYCYNLKNKMSEKQLKFNEYLKLCRQENSLTQEEFIQGIYDLDEQFMGVDTGTVSRWERDITQPSIDRQISIVKYFQTKSNDIFPCFNTYSPQEIQAHICKIGIENIIGKNKELVLNFPSSYIMADNLKITHLRHTEQIDNTIKIAISLDQEFTNNYSQLSDKNFKSWAIHPSSLFLICEYNEQFFGLLFTLKLKPEVFEKIMSFEMEEKDLSSKHFATSGEDGCDYLLNFFAQSQKAAALLYLRYYASLIANQNSILNVGALSMMEEGKKLIERINLSHYTDSEIDGHKLSSYQAPLDKVLINRDVLKMIFQKQECPEG